MATIAATVDEALAILKKPERPKWLSLQFLITEEIAKQIRDAIEDPAPRLTGPAVTAEAQAVLAEVMK